MIIMEEKNAPTRQGPSHIVRGQKLGGIPQMVEEDVNCNPSWMENGLKDRKRNFSR